MNIEKLKDENDPGIIPLDDENSEKNKALVIKK